MRLSMSILTGSTKCCIKAGDITENNNNDSNNNHNKNNNKSP